MPDPALGPLRSTPRTTWRPLASRANNPPAPPRFFGPLRLSLRVFTARRAPPPPPPPARGIARYEGGAFVSSEYSTEEGDSGLEPRGASDAAPGPVDKEDAWGGQLLLVAEDRSPTGRHYFERLPPPRRLVRCLRTPALRKGEEGDEGGLSRH
jgi:hypothetical protein